MDVRVFGIADAHTRDDISAWRPVHVEAFDPTWPEQFGYSPDFLRHLQDFKPDITHSHGIWAYSSVATNYYSRRVNRPYVVSPHGMLDPWAIRHSRWKKALSYWLFEERHVRSARCLRALCESEARAIRALGLKNDIAIIPNGIDTPAGLPSSPPPWADLLQPGQKVLLFLSRIHPKKGLVNLIKAWAQIQTSQASCLKSSPSAWILAIAGWDQGGHEGELKRLATELNLKWTDTRTDGNATPRAAPHNSKSISGENCSVAFLGPQFNDAKAACYHHCDGFVLPSFSEGLPMVVLEAWIHKKPVLITPQCNLPEAATEKAGLIADPGEKSLTDSLRILFEMDGSDFQTMGQRGFNLAKERFAWQAIAKQSDELYRWILGSGQRPSCLTDF